MSLWYWVRHGPTHADTLVGWRDIAADLTDTAALRNLRRFLPERATVVASDLVRASATADAITENRVRLRDDPHLREFHFGAWDDLSVDSAARLDPDLNHQYWHAPGPHAPPGGESWDMAAHRVETAVRRYEARHEGPFIAVGHIGVILTQVQAVTGHAPATLIKQKVDNLSVTVIDRGSRHASINHIP